jgi:hypothetical protein
VLRRAAQALNSSSVRFSASAAAKRFWLSALTSKHSGRQLRWMLHKIRLK